MLHIPKMPDQAKQSLTQIAPWLPTVLLAVFGFMFQDIQDGYKEKLAAYDKKLQSGNESQKQILTAVNDIRQGLTIVTTKQDSGRIEWDMREGRVLNAVEKLAGAVEKNTDRLNELDKRLAALEQKSN